MSEFGKSIRDPISCKFCHVFVLTLFWCLLCSSAEISRHILHTVLYTFPKSLIRRIRLPIKSIFHWWSFPLFSWPQCVIQGWYFEEKFDASHSQGWKGLMWYLNNYMWSKTKKNNFFRSPLYKSRLVNHLNLSVFSILCAWCWNNTRISLPDDQSQILPSFSTL